ncbi:MAG: hypothetical protein HUJ73_06875, partial [Eubacterium sp.]|nr:hypothetical protein [Eubacterium sp.]
MKKLIMVLCAAALIFSMTASRAKAEENSGQTVTGKVISIDGTKVTLQLGELTETEMNGQMTEMPGGNQQSGGQQPPE